MSDPNHPTNARRLIARQREERALAMRLEGKTFESIGDELGVSPQRAGQYVKQVLQATMKDIAEHADELRAMEAERLRELFEILRPQVLEGHLPAVDRYLKVSESFRKLTGLDLRPALEESQGDTYVFTGFPWDHVAPERKPSGEVVDGEATEVPGIGSGEF